MKALNVTQLYETIAGSHPSLLRGRVWCVKCGAFKDVEPAIALRQGWPKCHGATMSIEPASPAGEG